MFRQCCECKKIIWPWQRESHLSSYIHWSCHKKVLQRFYDDNPCYRIEFMRELHECHLTLSDLLDES